MDTNRTAKTSTMRRSQKEIRPSLVSDVCPRSWALRAGRRPPFSGETASDVLAAILRQEPAPLAGIAAVPEPLEAIVRKCLRKDRDERYQTAQDLLADLRQLKRELDSSERLAARPGWDRETEFLAAPGRSGTRWSAGPPGAGFPRRRSVLAWGAALAGAGGLAALGFELLRPKSPISPENLRITRFATSSDLDRAIVSPDGRYVAYTVVTRGNDSLWVKQLVPGSNDIPILAPAERAITDLSYSLKGGLERPLVVLRQENLRGASVTPDGQRAVYIAGRDISNLVMLRNFR